MPFELQHLNGCHCLGLVLLVGCLANLSQKEEPDLGFPLQHRLKFR